MPGFGKTLVAKLRRYLTFASGLVECLCFAGVVFGWASLVFVLKEEDYFGSLCVNTTGVNATDNLDCSGQDEKFSLVFTIASFIDNFLTLLSGFLFDYFGTTVTRLFAIVLYTTGTLLIAFSSPGLSNLLFPALPLLAVGGVLFLITNMQVANLFSVHRSTIITLYNGAFDSSSAVFFVVKMVHEVGISLQASFLFLSACSVIHLFRTLFLMPRKFIPYLLPDNYTYGITCGKLTNQNSELALNGDAPTMAEDVPADQDQGVEATDKNFRQCVLSWFFLWHLIWLSVMQLRLYLFVGTFNLMLQRLTAGDQSLVSNYTNAFGITQLCGLLCAPWNGFIIDRIKHKYQSTGLSEQQANLQAMVLSLFLTVLQCVLFSICATIPFLPLQYLTFILQVLNRSFLYGGHAAFISVVFPSRHFGKLYGLTLALSAVVLPLQYPCFSLVRDVLDGDPLYLNIGLTLLCLFALIHPIYVLVHCRRTASQ